MCFRPPTGLIAKLRRATGDPRLTLRFAPKAMQVVPETGKPSGVRGCWVVCRTVKMPFTFQWDGQWITGSHPILFPQPGWTLDGKYGTPLWPGPWLIPLLNMGDLAKRGVAVLDEQEQHRRDALAEQERQEADQWAALSKDMEHAFREARDIAGLARPSREENIARGKRAEAREEAQHIEMQSEVFEERLFEENA